MRSATASLRSQEERDRLVEQFLPLVRYVVARLPVTMPATLDRDDFYSVGIMGLIHAASTYDPSRGASFKTFAYTAIRGAILDEIRKHDPVPRNRRDRLRRLDGVAGRLHAQLDRPPTLEEIAREMDITVEELDGDLLALHTCRTLSLDESLFGNGLGDSLHSVIAGGTSPDPGDSAQRHEDGDLLAKAISELPDVDRHVLVLYYYEDLYLKEIGRILGVSESRVSQILSRATARLRLKLDKKEE